MDQIIKIVEENFKNIDPQLLLDPKWYPDIEGMILSVDAAETPDYSKQYAIVLADKLAKIGNKMPSDIADKYFRLLKVLRLGSLLSVSDNEKEKFFRELILDTFGLDFVNVKNKIDFVFRSYFDAKEIVEDLRSLFLRGIEKNIELLGNNNIVATVAGEDKLVRPTLQNWLTDYNGSAHINPEIKKRGGYEQVNYITNSRNTKGLNKTDRDVLLKILQFYD